MHYYTYAYLREDKTPYYIGKGKGYRIYSTNRKGLKPPKDKSRIIYLKKNLTEEEAFRHEIYMISIFGRKDLGTGILHNRTDGGDGASGAVISVEHKEKISLANKGRIKSEEGIRRISESSRGRVHTEESKRKIGEASRGNTHALGLVHTKESRRKMSESGKGRPSTKKGKTLSEDTKRKMSDAQKGMKLWNDGCGNCKRMIECPGDGWKPGRK